MHLENDILFLERIDKSVKILESKWDSFWETFSTSGDSKLMDDRTKEYLKIIGEFGFALKTITSIALELSWMS